MRDGKPYNLRAGYLSHYLMALCGINADDLCVQQGKTMRNHWQKKLDEGVTPEQARDQYVELVEKFKKTYGTK